MLGTNAVDRNHERGVGDAIAHDDVLPQRLGVEVRMMGLTSNRRGIHQHFGPGQRVGPCQFGEPLVPAGGEAECHITNGHHRKSPIALREEQVLGVSLGHGDVQLAGGGHQGPNRIHAYRGVPTPGRHCRIGLPQRCLYRDPVLKGHSTGKGQREPFRQRLGGCVNCLGPCPHCRKVGRQRELR